MNLLSFHSTSADTTFRLGEKIGRELQGGEIFALVGELGSGKTVFSKGLAAGLDVKDIVTSPTFLLVRSYNGRLPFHHFDFYRLQTPQDLDSFGFYEYFDSTCVCAMEWADRFFTFLPQPYLEVRFAQSGEYDRHISLSFTGNSETTEYRRIQSCLSAIHPQ